MGPPSTTTGPGSPSSGITWALSAPPRPACRRCSPEWPIATSCRSTSSGRAARTSSVLHALGQQGYQLRWVTPLGGDGPAPSLPGLDASTWYRIPSPYGSRRDYLAVSAALLLDLSLFRHAPHDLKASVYNDGRWLLQPRVAARMEVEAATERAAGDIRFLREFAGRISAGGDAPVYALLHVIAPHPPIVVDADCRYLGRNPPAFSTDSFDAQARCALSGVQDLLDRLRALDLYDRAAIVVTSDHGLAATTPGDHPLRGVRSPAGTSTGSRPMPRRCS